MVVLFSKNNSINKPMKKIYLLTFLLLLTQAIIAQNLHPYLQSVKPTSIYVSWKTDSNSETIVEYGMTPENLNVTVTGNTNVFTDSGYPGNYYYHSAKLINLTPNTKYYYQIRTGNDTSDIQSFKTLPNPGEAATEDGHIRFLIMGDNQLKNVPRYDSLVSAAKRKIQQKWPEASSVEDNIALTFMVGDQVDVGTLDHYEFVHFDKNKELSGNLPIQTTVGNHETYGTLGMQAYYDHFFIDDLDYQGISSETENYYAYQAGNVLFVSLSSEHTGVEQFSWLNQVLSAANDDPTVEWIISLSHKPYQAEQYVGDISHWVRNTAVPLLVTSSKYILHIGAHHHLYHRGQLKNTPTYNIISGGTAWDQYWGMDSEEDFEDVQKTINNWMYQIIDIDVINGTMDVESYSIGSIYQWKDNQLMDEFHHYKDRPEPAQPSILNDFEGEQTLPLTIMGSEFETSTEEQLNTTQFLISKTSDFSIIEKEIYRDYENLFGMYETQVDSTADLNLGVNILNVTLEENEIPNGEYFVKTRHRDQNLEWSPFSETKTFTIIGSEFVETEISLDAEHYAPNSPIVIQYTDVPNTDNTWIGIYNASQTPGSGSPSILWEYTDGNANGTLTFEGGLPSVGQYYVAIFELDGYTEIASRKYFYVGVIPELSVNAEEFAVGDPVNITFENAPNLSNDWVGIYKMSQTPGGGVGATAYQYTSDTTQTMTFSGLQKGYYFAEYFLEDGYESIGNKVYFKVGELISELWINEPVYELGENIVASWTDAPGIIKDWLGIYHEGDDPNIDELISYTYFDGQGEGVKTIADEEMPSEVGNYFIVMFTNDSYEEVSNRVNFEITDSTVDNGEFDFENGLKVYPNPTKDNKTVVSSQYPIDKIEIFNISGQKVYETRNVNNNKYLLMTQDMSPGTYILKIHSKKVYTSKLIVK